jgi:hypothetical protein
MIDPQHLGLLANIGKTAAPFLARILMFSSLVKLFPLAESYLAFVQGKGAGTGWDIRTEANMAALHVHRSDAVIFNVGAHQGK